MIPAVSVSFICREKDEKTGLLRFNPLLIWKGHALAVASPWVEGEERLTGNIGHAAAENSGWKHGCERVCSDRDHGGISIRLYHCIFELSQCHASSGLRKSSPSRCAGGFRYLGRTCRSDADHLSFGARHSPALDLRYCYYRGLHHQRVCRSSCTSQYTAHAEFFLIIRL